MRCPVAREAEAALENACARPVEKVTAGFRMSAAMARFWRQFFLVPKCQLKFKSTCQLNMKIDFQKTTYISRKLVEKVTKYHPIFTLQKPDFPRNPGGIF